MKYIILLLAFSLTAHSQTKGSTYHLPAIDVVAEKNKAISSKEVPLKYAISTTINDVFHKKGQSKRGTWQQLADDSWEYTLRFEAKNASSLNVGMDAFFLPHSAELWVSTDDNSILRGPYNDTYNKNHGFFWIGDVPADHLNLKITVSNQEKDYLSFNVTNVTRGFYKYWQEPSYLNKSGSCNVDVACPESSGWEAEISAVGRYSFTTTEGSFLCTGQLINNTAQDGRPLFSTADHCGYSGNSGQRPLIERQNTAASISITWNYQSQTCRTPGSTQSGIQISTSGFNNRQAGATYLASNPNSDFSLVELNQVPNPSYGIEYTGWDRTDTAPNSAVSIHHPSGHAKRISFEDDPLSITTFYGTTRGTGTYLRVAGWDLGTTEGGSSGSGLWNENKLFVGQLHGGNAACGNNEPDWYGRLNYSWDNGTTAQSRLKDWLDPLNTGQETLQGIEGCDAPSVSINNASSNSVGDLLTFSSVVTGGAAGGYTYEWDINGDAVIDGRNSQIQSRYSQAYIGNVNLKVIDSSGCQASTSTAVIVQGANIQLQEIPTIAQNLTQICGNNDSIIDPGERWSTLVGAKNVGSKLANDAYLAMSKSRRSPTNGPNDNYGNQASSCDRMFIDIASVGNLKSWQAAANVNNATASDEGSALVQLSQAFDHYGQAVNQLRVSTNGFISTSSDATGGDWDNDCPLPKAPDKDNSGARIYPMHDDLKDALFYHQYFASCPRTAETGANLACEVFLWKNADLYDTTVTESIDIQAILYPATSQWVFQYAGTGLSGVGASVGMQNTAATDGISFGCNSANSINTAAAVCMFNKNNLPISTGADYVMLETPLISLGDISVNQLKTENLDFAIASDATCGADFAINHEASVYDKGFNTGQNTVFTGTIGQNGQCNVVNNCGVDPVNNDIQPRNGLWWNPQRSGNGIDMHVSNNESLLYVMYTGKPDRTPIWYIANTNDSAFNQYYNDILLVNYPGGYSPNIPMPTPATIGWSNTTFIDSKKAIQVRSINGQLSAEKIQLDQFDEDFTPNYHTGHFYSRAENGWGQSVITLGATQVVISYIYDLAGKPFWTIASGANDNSEKSVVTADTFCPHCPAVPLEAFTVGTIRMTFNGTNTGIIDEYIISYPEQSAQPQATWNKTNLSIENIVPSGN